MACSIKASVVPIKSAFTTPISRPPTIPMGRATIPAPHIRSVNATTARMTTQPRTIERPVACKASRYRCNVDKSSVDTGKLE
ncbi:MAG: hypothetical protein AMXMBFR67_17430 [Nitrospira sp.]